jgi:hypothetical protein
MRPLQINTEPGFWKGALREPEGVAGVERTCTRALIPVEISFDWFWYCSPSINQDGNSCVGWGWAHWLTAMVRRYRDANAFAGGAQIDGQAVWQRGREMFWNGDMTGGLYLPQGFSALVDLGAIPPDSKLVEVNDDWDSVGLALRDTPLVQGHDIDSGWFRADPLNGCIGDAERPDGEEGSHCTLRIARLRQLAVQYYALANSWGDGWGRYGYGLMTEVKNEASTMGPCYTARLPAGWQADDGWKRLLKAET